VPLVITGPGISAGVTTPEIAENIDLYPTFLELTGIELSGSIDGHSLVPLLRGQKLDDWRTSALIEHHGPRHEPADPDAPGLRSQSAYL
jgi:arylsulfatase A-like enzyme